MKRRVCEHPPFSFLQGGSAALFFLKNPGFCGQIKVFPALYLRGKKRRASTACVATLANFGFRESLVPKHKIAFWDTPKPLPLAVFSVGQVPQQHLVAAVAFARVVADELDHPLARRPRLLTRRVMVAELFLRPDLVFQGTPLEAVGNGRYSNPIAVIKNGYFSTKPFNIFKARFS